MFVIKFILREYDRQRKEFENREEVSGSLIYSYLPIGTLLILDMLYEYSYFLNILLKNQKMNKHFTRAYEEKETMRRIIHSINAMPPDQQKALFEKIKGGETKKC